MAANSSLNLTSLDFDILKENFKTYLKTQTAFKDYNFEGSNINVLLDVLSYNTYMNSFYLNMIASEMFLDSAQKMDSVVSHAKELNYLPRSTRSSKAVVSFTVDYQGNTSPFIIPKGTIFNGLNANGSYNFVTNESRTFLSSNSTYTIEDLEIYEGSYIQDTFIVDSSIENQKFVLSNKNVDTTSITVIVSDDNGQTNTDYSYTETLFDLNSNSTVYFLQATYNEQYEIVFGDDIFGKKPKNQSVIYVNYRISSGSDSNGISEFSISDDLGKINNNGIANPSVITVVSNAVSGAPAESIESVRFNAPRHFQRQGRCITESDYISAVLQNYPEIQHVNVFSGEITNTSVEFGTVYIAPSTYSGAVLTNSRKNDIETYINTLSPIGIKTKVVDPDYLYIIIESLIHVNFKNTTSSPSYIITKAIATSKNFNVAYLQNMNTAFRMSKFEQAINDSDVGILSNETKARIYKLFSPPLDKLTTISCDFMNKLIKGSITSSTFTTGGKNYILTDYIPGVDTGSGILYQYEQNPNLSTPNYITKGVVDYNTGRVNVNEISYHDINGGIKIYAEPYNQDIYSYKNTIIEFDTISGLNFTTVSE